MLNSKSYELGNIIYRNISADAEIGEDGFNLFSTLSDVNSTKFAEKLEINSDAPMRKKYVRGFVYGLKKILSAEEYDFVFNERKTTERGQVLVSFCDVAQKILKARNKFEKLKALYPWEGVATFERRLFNTFELFLQKGQFTREKSKKYYEDNRQEFLSKAREYRLNNQNKIIAGRKAYYLKNKDKILEKDRLYRENNKDKIRARTATYYKNNGDKIKLKNKSYVERNKEKVAARIKAYYEKNKESILLKQKERRENIKDKIRAYYVEYHKKNKESRKAYNKEYRQNNYDRINAQRRKKYQNLSPEEKEYILTYQKEYREKNKERINAQKREHYARKKAEKLAAEQAQKAVQNG